MKPSSLDRRAALAGAVGALGAAAFARIRTHRASAESRRSEPILVLLELFGGVDGLSTVVPFAFDEYHRARPTTRLEPASVLRLSDERGLHPSLWQLRERFERGEVAVVEGCGYPAPIYSHFRAMEVWHTGRREGRASGDGWIGRLRTAAWPGRDEPELVVHIGSEMPWSVSCAERPPIVFGSADNFRALGRQREQFAVGLAGQAADDGAQDGSPRSALLASMRSTLTTSSEVSGRLQAAVRRYRPRVAYPDHALAEKFRTIAAMIDAGFATRVYSLAHGNYDTHGGIQNAVYGRLHMRLDQSLHAFLSDLEASSRGREVVVLAFSEFGRRFHENESKGTDHGAAGPMLVIGPRVRGGLHGRHPSLTEVDADDNLIHTTDFRRVYAAVIERHFGVAPERVLGAPIEPLDLLG